MKTKKKTFTNIKHEVGYTGGYRILFVETDRFVVFSCLFSHGSRIVYDKLNDQRVDPCKGCGKERCVGRKVVENYFNQEDPLSFTPEILLPTTKSKTTIKKKTSSKRKVQISAYKKIFKEVKKHEVIDLGKYWKEHLKDVWSSSSNFVKGLETYIKKSNNKKIKLNNLGRKGKELVYTRGEEKNVL